MCSVKQELLIAQANTNTDAYVANSQTEEYTEPFTIPVYFSREEPEHLVYCGYGHSAQLPALLCLLLQ